MKNIAVQPLRPADPRADARPPNRPSGESDSPGQGRQRAVYVHDFLVLNPCPDLLAGQQPIPAEWRPRSP